MTTFDQDQRQRQTTSNDITSDIKSASAEASSTIKQKAKQNLEENRSTAASEMEKVAHATRAAAEDLREQDREGLSTYVAELADSVSNFAQGLRHKSVDELIHEAEKIARNNPALFIGGSIAIGLGIARFAKASSHRTHHDELTFGQQSGANHTTATTTSSTVTSDYTEEDWLGSTPQRGNGLPKSDGNSANSIGGTRYE